jgi:hypothetical protein
MKDNSSLKKVLVITYYFPPCGGPPVQRIVKFVRYLPLFGWDSVVLTAKEGFWEGVLDEEL